jgi:hypothetical protein
MNTVEVDPDEEENRARFEAARRKAQGVRDWIFSLRPIATQHSVWHPHAVHSRDKIQEELSKYSIRSW